ncbi:MAG: serine hydrolase domain-containing protein, partial [Gemmatimonadota bacterium]
MFLRLIATLAASSIAAANILAQGLPPGAGQRIDSLFSGLTQAASPGVSVAIVRDGQIVMTKGYGLASLEHQIPITDSTVFDIASISKQFAGLSVAMLADQGRVNLDDDIT